MQNKVSLSRFESLPVTVISSFGHNGLDWVHSLLDGHPDIVLMPAYSFFRTLEFFKIKFGCDLKGLTDPKEISKKLSEFLYTDPSYKVVRRQFLHNADQARVFEDSLRFFLEESTQINMTKKLFFGINYSYCIVHGVDLSRIQMVVSQEHVSWHSEEYQKEFNPKFILMMRDPRAGLAGSWKRQAENAGFKRLNPFDFDKGILAGTYLESFYKKSIRNNKSSNIKVMVNERMHEDLDSEMNNLCSWLGIKFQSSCLEETFLGLEWLGESSYLGVDELTEKPPEDFYTIENIEARWRGRLTGDEINMIEFLFSYSFCSYNYKKDFEPKYSNYFKALIKYFFTCITNQEEKISLALILKVFRNLVRRFFILYFPLYVPKIFRIP